jgi:hypothetical protein
MVMGLCGCSSADEQLPSLSEDTGSQDTLEAIASAFYSCLCDVELPAMYEIHQGRPILVRFDETVPVFWRYPGQTLMFTSAVSQDDVEIVFNDEGSDDLSPLLIVKGLDSSNLFSECLESSGYDEAQVFSETESTSIVATYVRLTVDASNEWANCARENGWATVKDAVLPLDPSNSPAPMVLLPPSIEEMELRALLVTCPAFLPDRAKKNEELLLTQSGPASFPDGYQEQPNIGFDYPGFRNDELDPGGSVQDETAIKLALLSQILAEAENSYWDE